MRAAVGDGYLLWIPYGSAGWMTRSIPGSTQIWAGVDAWACSCVAAWRWCEEGEGEERVGIMNCGVGAYDLSAAARYKMRGKS